MTSRIGLGRWAGLGGLMAVAAFGLFMALPHPGPAKAGVVPTMHFDLYEPQKVVYHVTTGGGWFGREHAHLITVLNNHINAVGEDSLDLHVVMQGDGLDLLIAARKDAKLAAAIERLKKAGAHFSICYNTIVQRHLDPFADLYGVKQADIVAAGVAEVTALVNRGYAYLRI